MPEQFRNRDCHVLVKGDLFTVTVSDEMAQNGWPGGQGVQWTSPVKDELLVTFSDGLYAGVLIWGSDELSDRFTAMTLNQPQYRFATIMAGGSLIETTTYEKYTWASRQVGPLVPLTYTESDRLVFSLRGYWTTEDEWTLSGDLRAPNSYFIGFVARAPSASNNFYMTVQTSI